MSKGNKMNQADNNWVDDYVFPLSLRKLQELISRMLTEYHNISKIDQAWSEAVQLGLLPWEKTIVRRLRLL